MPTADLPATAVWIAEIPREQIAAAIIQLSARLLEPVPAAPSTPDSAVDEDRLLTTAEAAAMLGHSTKWIYRHVKDLPFARRMGPRDLRFSLKGLRAWQSRQKV